MPLTKYQEDEIQSLRDRLMEAGMSQDYINSMVDIKTKHYAGLGEDETLGLNETGRSNLQSEDEIFDTGKGDKKNSFAEAQKQYDLAVDEAPTAAATDFENYKKQNKDRTKSVYGGKGEFKTVLQDYDNPEYIKSLNEKMTYDHLKNSDYIQKQVMPSIMNANADLVDKKASELIEKYNITPETSPNDPKYIQAQQEMDMLQGKLFYNDKRVQNVITSYSNELNKLHGIDKSGYMVDKHTPDNWKAIDLKWNVKGLPLSPMSLYNSIFSAGTDVKSVGAAGQAGEYQKRFNKYQSNLALAQKNNWDDDTEGFENENGDFTHRKDGFMKSAGYNKPISWGEHKEKMSKTIVDNEKTYKKDLAEILERRDISSHYERADFDKFASGDNSLRELSLMLTEQGFNMIGAVATLGGLPSVMEGASIYETRVADRARKMFDLEENEQPTPDQLYQAVLSDTENKDGKIAAETGFAIGLSETAASAFVVGKTGLLMKKSYGSLVKGQYKRFLKNTMKTGGTMVAGGFGEGLTEGFQTALSSAATGHWSMDEFRQAMGTGAVVGTLIPGMGNVVSNTVKETKAATSSIASRFDKNSTRNIIGAHIKQLNKARKDGTISEQEYIEKSEILNDVKKSNDKVPSDFNVKNKKEAIDLLTQKAGLQREIDKIGDKALAKGKQDQIAEIDTKLEEVSVRDRFEKQQEKVEKVAGEIFGEDVKARNVTSEEAVTMAKAQSKEEYDLINEDLANPNINERQREELNERKTAIENQIKSAETSFGFYDPVTKTMVLNKEASVAQGFVTTSSHELLHAILQNTIAESPKIRAELGGALGRYLLEIDTGQLQDSEYVRRLDAYQQDPNNIAGEEMITLFSEALQRGDIQYNESVFTKLKDTFRRLLQRFSKDKGKIEFNTGKDVFNFIKDYNKTIESGRVSQGIKTLALKGADGKLIKPTPTENVKPILKQSKADEVNRIYKEQGVKGAGVIASPDGPYRGMAEKIFERNLAFAPSQDIRENLVNNKDFIIGDILYSPGTETAKARTVLGLVQDYPDYVKKQEKEGKKVAPLAGFINTWIGERSKEVFKPYGIDMAITKSMEQEGVAAEIGRIEAEEVATEVKAKPKPKKIVLADRLGVKAKVDKTIKAKLPELDIENLNFKTLKDQTPEITGEMFGISPKKLISGANITKKELQSAQMFINKNADILISMLPEGATTGGTATGVPQTLLKAFYTKTDRAKMAKTGTKAGLAIQVKNNIKKSDFLETFGIIDGKPVRTDRNTSARVLALANQTGKMMTNQAVRQEIEKQGDVSQSVVLKLQDGKSSVMFSKAIPESKHDVYYAKYGDLVTEISNSNNKDIESIKNRVTNTFKDDLTKNEILKVSKEIFKNIEQYGVLEKKHVMPSGKKVDMPRTLQEFLIDKAVEDNLDYGVKEMLKKYLPKDKNGKTINIGTHYLDKNRILRHRALPVDLGKQIVEEMGLEKGVEFILKYYQGMFSGLSRIADGRYIFKNGALIDNPNYKPLVPKKDKDGVVKMVPPKNRKQVFQSVPDFVENVIGKLGVNVYNENGSIKTVNQIQKDLGINTTLLAEKSEAALKDMDFIGREAQANEAKKAVIKMMDFITKTEGYDSADVGMLVTSMGSGMTSVTRRAANFKYIGIGVENSKNPGKELEYEHMIPQVEMSLKVLKGYLENGSVDNSVWEGYHVAIIPKTMDKVLVENGFRSKSPVSGNRYYNMFNFGDKRLVPIKSIDPKDKGLIIGEDFVKAGNILNKTAKEIQDIGVLERAYMFSRSAKNPAKGITVLDFDDTLATSKSKVISTSPEGIVRKLTAEEFANEGADLLDQGWKHDFSEFSKVVDGKVASLFNKAMKLQGKFGSENMFVLTARPADSASAIFEFLKANGLNIPLKNITGLANSTPEAKALWIADKVGEGYNDFYFADDALQNVQAVKNMLDQFDVKSKVQQARIKFSKDMSGNFNNIIEKTTGVESQKQFSNAQARLRGQKTKYKSIIPASAQDFQGLLYNFLGKGKQGETDMAFFKKALIDPFSRGINELNSSRQSAANDFKNLNKNFPDVKKKLNKNIEGLDYTYDQAMRVYLWNKAGFEVPGLSKRDLAALTSVIQKDPQLEAYADTIGLISKKDDGYSKPKDYWLAESIASDLLSDGAIGDKRSDFLAEWIENKNMIFSPENLNKIEAIYGSKFREALEDMLYRMETGRNRPMGGGRLVNSFMNWTNNSVGAIMFLNLRSATLQTISAANYINWSDNNPAKAAAAFANQPQFWKDFSYIFNSDYLKQRRSGNQRGVNEAELSEAIAGSDNKAKAAIAWLLKKGFTPTQIADSFAISMGGSTFYRNRIKKYVKDGMTQKEAETKAWLDFQEITEVNQQSARPDMISQQQASPLGRLILAFQNTPMQYARIMNKATRDLVNGRGDYKTHISKIAYYGIAQSIIFGALQSALYASLGDDEEEDFDKKKERILNQMVDSWLTGIGYGGKAIGTVKNTLMEYFKQRDKGFQSDHAYTLLTLLSFSPPIGSKLRKVYSSIKTEEFNRGVFSKRGFSLDNPIWSGIGNVVEGVTNVPLGRMSNLMLQLDNAMDPAHKWWERVALLLGQNTWDLGIKDPDIEAAKLEIKAEKKEASKIKAKIKKEEKKKEKEEADKAVIEKNKEKSKKDGVCSAVSKGGNRCGNKVVAGKSFCTVHEKTEQRVDGKETRCKKTKKDGKRCGMMTTNKSGYCYYHD